MVISDLVKNLVFDFFDNATTKEIAIYLIMKEEREKVRKEKINEISKQAKTSEDFKPLLHTVIFIDDLLSTIKYSTLEAIESEYLTMTHDEIENKLKRNNYER